MTTKIQAEVRSTSTAANETTEGRTKQVLQEEAKRVRICPVCGSSQFGPYSNRDDLGRTWILCENCGLNERLFPLPCDSCGRLVCGNRGNPAVIKCQQYETPGFLARMYRDEPPNERVIRGRC